MGLCVLFANCDDLSPCRIFGMTYLKILGSDPDNTTRTSFNRSFASALPDGKILSIIYRVVGKM